MKTYKIKQDTVIEMKDKKNLILETGDQIKIYTKKTGSLKESYNGWSNYITWAVNLWMDNDGVSNSWGERVQEEPRLDARRLASMIKDDYEDEAYSFTRGKANLWSDLINNALSEVNWQEIAEGIIEGYRY